MKQSVMSSGLGLIAMVAAGVLLAACGRGSDPAATDQRVIIIGIDGMDPKRIQSLMEAGKMPTFSGLAARGTFQRLATSVPPQSPVAWSNFITGMNPGGHGVFDFLRHDPRNFSVSLATSRVKKPGRFLGIPMGGGMVNLRQGKAFWEYLEDRGIPATVFRVPANFPPVGTSARTFSGLGTPDLRGSSGQFTYYTDDPPENAKKITGGEVVPVAVENHVVRTRLAGPPNPFREDRAEVSVPVTVFVDPARKGVRIDVGESKVLLTPGELSDWVRVTFPFVPAVASASGIVRFYLKSLDPHFRLYVTALNVDPADPAFPISTPEEAVQEQHRHLGPFYTQGMPVDTKALQWRVLDEEEFLLQAMSVLRERERFLEYELRRFRGTTGFLFFYFATVDLTSHMMWSAMDPKHPDYREGLSDRVRTAMTTIYREFDRILGRVLEEVDDRTTLVVMSDHGFAPYYRQVHLNNWLLDEGFLCLYDAGKFEKASLQGDQVDWLRTRAYAIGFNGVFLNLQGREAMGRVSLRNRDKVLGEIERKLLRWRDPATGKAVVSRVYRSDRVYSGPHVHAAPDLIIGYARGYRASNGTALGEFGSTVLEDNRDTWSADHMMAAEEVPGILLANRPVLKQNPGLVDLPVTILEIFGIPRPEAMVGASLFRQGE